MLHFAPTIAGGAPLWASFIGEDVAFTVSPAGLASGAAFGVPTFTFDGPQSFEIAVPGLASDAAFGVPSFSFSDGSYVPGALNARRLVVTPDPRLQGTTLPGSGGPFLQPLPMSPASHLDLEWDWRQWLDAGDLAAGFQIRWDGEVLGDLADQADADGVVRIWLTLPAEAAEGARSRLLCEITTTAGRIDSRKYELLVKQL